MTAKDWEGIYWLEEYWSQFAQSSLFDSKRGYPRGFPSPLDACPYEIFRDA